MKEKMQKRTLGNSNIAAVDIELTSEDLEQIDDALSKIDIQSAQYPNDLQERTGN